MLIKIKSPGPNPRTVSDTPLVGNYSAGYPALFRTGIVTSRNYSPLYHRIILFRAVKRFHLGSSVPKVKSLTLFGTEVPRSNK
jgi:hypothetical protein